MKEFIEKNISRASVSKGQKISNHELLLINSVIVTIITRIISQSCKCTKILHCRYSCFGFRNIFNIFFGRIGVIVGLLVIVVDLPLRVVVVLELLGVVFDDRVALAVAFAHNHPTQ